MTHENSKNCRLYGWIDMPPENWAILLKFNDFSKTRKLFPGKRVYVMSNVEIINQIYFKPTEAITVGANMPCKIDDGCFRLILDGSASCDIDAMENCLLRTNYPALRDALATHCKAESKNKALMEQNRHGTGYEIIKHTSEYKVDGEVGRFKFSLFNVVGPDGVKVFKGTEYWPTRS